MWTWKKNLKRSRSRAASIVIDNGNTLFIAGGSNNRRTEFVTLTGSTNGPKLPSVFKKVDEQSFAKIDETRAILTGGYRFGGGSWGRIMTEEERGGGGGGSNKFKKEAYFYNIDAKSFTKAPDMNERRAHHYSGVLKDTTDGTTIVVVAGGRNSYHQDQGILDSTEILVDGATSWISSTPIPEAIYDGTMVPGGDGETLFLIGGKVKVETGSGRGHWNNWEYPAPTDVVYKVTCSNQVLFWEKVDPLSAPRSGHVSMRVPDSLVSTP